MLRRDIDRRFYLMEIKKKEETFLLLSKSVVVILCYTNQTMIMIHLSLSLEGHMHVDVVGLKAHIILLCYTISGWVCMCVCILCVRVVGRPNASIMTS